jgi:hypothetical protein
MTSRIFDPNEVVCTATAHGVTIADAIKAADEDRENAKRERDMRAIGFGSRSSYCG